MMNSKDLLAKLLANENLNVIRANVATASFESFTRTLTLPQWKDMTTEVEEMLIGHEVGHALYTTTEHIEKEDFRKLQGYMNVIEDVRIEKKIKNKYPGLRKAFITAYKELKEKDFFGIQDKDLSDILLIDRINLYYKCGFNCGVKFNSEEMNLVRKVDRCDSMEDVYKLAQEIYSYAKDERDAKQQQLKELRELNGEDEKEEVEFDNFMDDPDDFDDYQPDEEIEDEDQKAPKSNKSDPEAEKKEEQAQEEEDLESKTQKSFAERLKDLADTETIVQNFTPKLESTRDPIVGYKTILSELKEAKPALYQRMVNYHDKEHADRWVAKQQVDLLKFKTDSMRVVNYLVKEFEMRKSATEYKRITTSKSGDLDMRKLYAHTLTDDIFKKLDVLPEDKDHGMIFLLDWSGSMSGVMDDTIKQVINLAMFCQRIQIPYQVFAFTTGRSSSRDEDILRRAGANSAAETMSGFADTGYHLLEFFNNKMTNSEFNAMIDYLFNRPWAYSRDYDLNSTPLNESLLFLCDYVGTFIKKNTVEKMSLITLTDGSGHAIHGAGQSLRSYKHSDDYKTTYKVKNFIRDPMTKKEYPLSDNGGEQTRTFLRIIKDRYGIKTVGFHVAHNSRRDIGCFIRDNVGGVSNSQEYYMTEQIRKDIRQNDYALIQNTGRDEMYLLSASKQKIEEGDLKIDSTANAKSIAKQFSKYLGVKKSSRVVLSRFVGLVA